MLVNVVELRGFELLNSAGENRPEQRTLLFQTCSAGLLVLRKPVGVFRDGTGSRTRGGF